MNRIAAVLCGLVVALLGGSAVSAYPPGEPVLVPSATELAPGEPFEVVLQGCSPGEPVSFDVEGSSDSSTCEAAVTPAPAGESVALLEVAPGTGVATGELTAPTTPGTYTVTGRGETSGIVATAEITVLGDGEEPPPDDGDDGDAAGAADGAAGGGLPATGSSSTTPALQIAGIALLSGLGLIAVSLRRRHNATVT